MKNLYRIILLLYAGIFSNIHGANSYLETSAIQQTSDSIVCDLTVNGNSIVGFTPLVIVYDMVLPYNSPIPPIGVALCDSLNELISVVQTDPSSFPGTSIITFETDQGDATYYINWTYEIPSSDAGVISITSDTGMWCTDFHPDVYNYEVDIGSGSTALTILTVVPSDTNATITMEGDGTEAPYGEIIITVVAEDDLTTNVYVVYIGNGCAPNNYGALIFESDLNANWCESFYPINDYYYLEVDFPFTGNILDYVSGKYGMVEVNSGPDSIDNSYEISVHGYVYTIYLVEDCPPLSVQEEFALDYTLYPNPSSNIVNFQINSEVATQVNLVNLFGKTIYSYFLEEGEGSLPIDVSGYAPGVYFLQILQNGNSIQSEKIILK